MGIAKKAGLFLILSLFLILVTGLFRTRPTPSKEDLPGQNQEAALPGLETVVQVAEAPRETLPKRPRPARTPEPVRMTTVYYSEQDIPLYDSTGPGRTRILVIPGGTHLFSWERSGAWHQVEYAGNEGYVESSRLQSSEVPTVEGVIIANKGYALPKEFCPGQNPEAYHAFLRMKKDAEKEGVTLRLSTTYRSFSAQQHIYRTFVDRAGKARADTYSARPGHSEHQTGLAFDIGGENPEFRLKQALGKMKEGVWMAQNAPRYGFILRYPEGKQEQTGYIYEPWHFRYVGVELAKRITSSGLSFDEYFGVVHPDYR